MAQLRQHREAFASLGVHVWLISFGKAHWAALWQEEMGSPFPLLLDQDRHVYDAYGLLSSVTGTWGPSTLWYYARQIMRGRWPKPIRNDPHQMGGDFIVDARGVLRFAHRSHTPLDRPEAELLLDIFRGMIA